MRARRYLKPITAVFGVLTLLLLSRMLQCLWLSITDVLVRDQWFMLDELIRLHQGKVGLGYLWVPYWGQRIVIPRLIFWLDERFSHFANVPLVAINIASQGFVCAALIFLARGALRSYSRPIRVLVGLAITQLCFSSLQMENFVYGMAIQYTLGCASALAAFLLLAYANNSRFRFALAVGAALFSTLTSAAGVLLWPIMIAEALVLRASRARAGLLAVLFCVIAVAYSLGFYNIGGGMRLAGMARHPLTGIWIASMVIGGPLSIFNLLVGQVAGLFGIGAVIFLCFALSKSRLQGDKSRLALTSICCFFLVVAFSIVAGRLSPEFVASFKGLAVVPSRYFSFCFLFWAALLPCVLAPVSSHLLTQLFRAGTVLTIGGLTLGTAAWQLQESLDWVAFTRQLEAASSSFFAMTDDPQNTAIIFPDQNALDRWIPYLREHRLSVFQGPHAQRIGQPVSAIIGSTQSDTCRGSLQPPSPSGRVTGTISKEFTLRYGGTDIIFADANSRVVGFGRTSFDSHRSFPPNQYTVLGYVQRPVPASVTTWSIGNKTCHF